jgi:predicted Rossmann fold nucleotide-binding protein DprA/Smf involved in DNA uptake
MDDTTAVLVMLRELPGVGERTVHRIAQQSASRGLTLAALWALPTAVLAQEYALPPAARAHLDGHRAEHESRCRQLLAGLVARGVRISHPAASEYPRAWAERLDAPPPLVYAYGNPSLTGPRLALLSSREITERTVTATVALARAAARAGFALVTSGMKSTHRIAAVAARAAAAPRIIVLDRGLLAAFGAHLDRDPSGLGPGRAVFDPTRTLVLSPFRPFDHAAPGNGRRRDELIAALGDVVAAASARPGGETERICLRALDRGQCVLNWQGGSEALLSAGAVAIDEVDLHASLARAAGSR